MMGHPREVELLGFLDGGQPDGRRRALAAHLAACQRCRDVVQAHRRVRLALTATEPAPPPPMILDRVLATRASGEGVILPVDVEPRQGREWRLPFSTRRVAGGALAGALVLAVGLVLREVVPPLPVAALSEQTGTAFERLLEGLGNPRPSGPIFARPDAPPAVVHPERMRELTATYEARHYDADQRLIAVDSQTRISVRRRGDQWLVEERSREVDRYRDRIPVVRSAVRRNLSELSATDLRLQASHHEFRFEEPGERVQQTQQQYLGDSLIVLRSWYFDPNRRARPTLIDDTTIYRVTKPTTGPSKGYRLEGAALFLTVDLNRWWAGSFERYSRQQRRRTEFTAEASTQSFRVIGSEHLDLPIGRTETWAVEYWSEHYLAEAYRELYRKSDGLLAAILHEDVESGYTELRLLSVSYP